MTLSERTRKVPLVRVLPGRLETGKGSLSIQVIAVGPTSLSCSGEAVPAGTLLTGSPARLVLEGPRGPFELHGTVVETKDAAAPDLQAQPPAKQTEKQKIYELDVSEQGSRAKLHDLLAALRKEQHIDLCLSRDVEAHSRSAGFEDVFLRPRALPELSWAGLDTRTKFLGRSFALPLMITGMTGGVARAGMINLRLARAAAHHKIPMGVGSQRLALENPEHAGIFAIRDQVPDVFLIANIGIAQLGRSISVEHCREAVRMIGAEALAIHVNVLQEAIQVEGDLDFTGRLAAIARVVESVNVPVIVKEVGCGMDVATARALKSVGVKALDVGGVGGTSWGWIEGLRSGDPVRSRIGEAFRDWGLPTAVALRALTESFADLEVSATGGIRDGLTVAKAVALGACTVGIGLPLFRAALASEQGPMEELEFFSRGLRTAMLCSGSQTLNDLKARLSTGSHFLAQLDLAREC